MRKQKAYFVQRLKWSILLILLITVAILIDIDHTQANGDIPSGRISIQVGKNDSLWSIARRIDPDYDTNEIIWYLIHLNGLENRIVREGQILIFDYAAIR